MQKNKLQIKHPPRKIPDGRFILYLIQFSAVRLYVNCNVDNANVCRKDLHMKENIRNKEYRFRANKEKSDLIENVLSQLTFRISASTSDTWQQSEE